MINRGKDLGDIISKLPVRKIKKEKAEHLLPSLSIFHKNS